MPSGKSSPFSIAGVSVIFALLAFFASLVYFTSGRRGGPSRDRSEINALSTASESFRVEYGDYPRASGPIGPNETANANILYQALVISNAAYNPSGKVFFEPNKGICASTNYNSPTNYFVDPYGRPYQYRYPGDPQKSGTNFFDLFSYGKSTKTPDTPENWETWIKNW